MAIVQKTRANFLLKPSMSNWIRKCRTKEIDPHAHKSTVFRVKTNPSSIIYQEIHKVDRKSKITSFYLVVYYPHSRLSYKCPLQIKSCY